MFSNCFGVERLEEIQNSQNWVFQIVSNHFGAKSWKKFRLAKIWHSDFFKPFWCKKCNVLGKCYLKKIFVLQELLYHEKWPKIAFIKRKFSHLKFQVTPA